MEINKSNIFEIVNKADLKPDKDYGQNFLVEPLIAEKIVDALEVNNDDYVLEIGPGLGSLTHFLYHKSKLDVCDIDSRMIDFLKIFYKEDINYIRILGFNDLGREYLNKIKKSINIITNVKEGINDILDIEFMVSKVLDSIYNINLIEQEQKGPIRR